MTIALRPTKLHALRRSAQDHIFRRVHESQLIYNCAWEDPRVDRHLLQLTERSRVVMITSAGCNALDYLLDSPAEIHAVDMNFRQNAVLHLKQALLCQGDHGALFDLFGRGSNVRFREIYANVREALEEPSRTYWDANIAMFDPHTLRRSYYYHGTAGTAAWVMMRALLSKRGKLRLALTELLDAKSVEEQQKIYAQIEPALWGYFSRWLVKQPFMMTLLGVPRPQVRIIDAQYPGGLACFVEDKIKRVLTQVPITDNYFWRVYLTGRYEGACCPNYLRRSNMHLLAKRSERLVTHTSTLSDFLRAHPGSYSHFVLLDHQDWLAAHDVPALREEWDLILQNAAPGAKVLMRSAGLTLDFLPDDVRKKLRFHPLLTSALHAEIDRVGTYGSTHFAVIE